ncbi:hypothetical protein OJJOAM_000624 [Cupriavidus sp. H18C1]
MPGLPPKRHASGQSGTPIPPVHPASLMYNPDFPGKLGL